MKLAFGSAVIAGMVGSGSLAALKASGMYYSETYMRWHWSLRCLKVHLGL